MTWRCIRVEKTTLSEWNEIENKSIKDLRGHSQASLLSKTPTTNCQVWWKIIELRVDGCFIFDWNLLILEDWREGERWDFSASSFVKFYLKHYEFSKDIWANLISDKIRNIFWFSCNSWCIHWTLKFDRKTELSAALSENSLMML